MKKPPLSRSLAALSAACLLLLAACGGGGGGGAPGLPSAPPPTTPLGASAQYEGLCSLENQKKFTRTYLDEMYLWYNEIPEVNPAQYGNIPDYFNALLVKTPDANGQPRDRFSTVLPTSLSQGPQALAASPMTLLSQHTDAVPVAKVVTSPAGRRVGYIQFNDHESGAQDDLITAFRQIQAAGVQDLVLDLRFNSGGFLYVAQAAASMIVGPSAEGKVFERLQYNAKREAETAASTMLFSSRLQFGESQYPMGTMLPQLGLPRVFILTSGQTCSSSESIINGLRGIDLPVITVGTTTCGKPYGFRQKNNCGWAYFPIEFQGTNAKGFGGYTAGFRPTCEVQDDTTASAGSSSDPLLNGALLYADQGSCPLGTATNVQSAGTPILGRSEQPRRPSWTGRLLLPQQQQQR